MYNYRNEVTFVGWSIKYMLFAKYIIGEGYHFEKAFRGGNSMLLNAIRILSCKYCKKEISSLWYNRKLRNLKGTIIIFDTMLTIEFIEWVIENNPYAKVAFVLWNPISSVKVNINDLRNLNCEIWSYGDEQCLQYKVQQNLYFFIDSMYQNALSKKDNPVTDDVVFVGKDKGRLHKIQKMISDNVWGQYKWNLYICPDHFWQLYRNKCYRRTISYERTQEIQIKAKALLELVPSRSMIPTMRTIDALVLGRKLITDNINVIKEPYYHPNNIFVLGKDSPQQFEEFMNKPYVQISSDILRQYQFDLWIDRIVQDKPVNMMNEEYS